MSFRLAITVSFLAPVCASAELVTPFGDLIDLTLMAIDGEATPPLSIDSFLVETELSESVPPVPIRASLRGGSARWVEGGRNERVLKQGGNEQILPALMPGVNYEESFIDLRAGGRTAVVRFVSLPRENIVQLIEHFGAQHAGFLQLGSTHAIVDEYKLFLVDSLGYGEPITAATGGGGGSDLGDVEISFDPFAPIPTSAPQPGNFGAPSGTCFRPVWITQGDVYWIFPGAPHPANSPHYYSALPEDGPPLEWAQPLVQQIDAIYRRSWGCGIALKVPGNCTAEIEPASGSVCCNVFWKLAGYLPLFVATPQWVQTGPGSASNFPACPL